MHLNPKILDILKESKEPDVENYDLDDFTTELEDLIFILDNSIKVSEKKGTYIEIILYSLLALERLENAKD